MATGEIERAAGASTFSRWYGIRLTVQPRRYKTRRRLVIACVALVLLIWVATWVHSGTLRPSTKVTHRHARRARRARGAPGPRHASPPSAVAPPKRNRERAPRATEAKHHRILSVPPPVPPVANRDGNGADTTTFSAARYVRRCAQAGRRGRTRKRSAIRASLLTKHLQDGLLALSFLCCVVSSRGGEHAACHAQLLRGLIRRAL